WSGSGNQDRPLGRIGVGAEVILRLLISLGGGSQIIYRQFVFSEVNRNDQLLGPHFADWMTNSVHIVSNVQSRQSIPLLDQPPISETGTLRWRNFSEKFLTPG